MTDLARLKALQIALSKIRLKGDRNYAHGTDIFNTIITSIRDELPTIEIRDVDISFHRLINKRIRATQFLIDSQEAVAKFRCNLGGKELSFSLVEGDEFILERYAYPESRIIQHSFINASERCAVNFDSQGFSFIEVLVALTKSLHMELYGNHSGRWLFVRATFAEYLNSKCDGVEVKVCILSYLGNRFTRCGVQINGINVGEIYFLRTS